MANNSNDNPQAADSFNRARRSSVSSQTFTNLFGRSNSTANGATPSFPGPITTAAAQDQRRRMSIGQLGLSASPTQSGNFFGGRRGSVSTAGSDSIDENAIEDDEGPGKSNPTTPFVRRMSFGAQALRNVRGNGSPGTAAEGSFNWGEQVRSRAESAVSQNSRPSFSSPGFAKVNSMHDRSKSISEMPAPPTAVSGPSPRPAPKKPDAFQERILKGDFYMD